MCISFFLFLYFGNGKHTIFSDIHCFTYLSENLSIRPIPECLIEIVVSRDSRVDYNLRVSLIELLTDLKH